MTATDRARAATRKGLFEPRRRGGLWLGERTAFLGEPVTMLLPPDAQGRALSGAEPGPLRRRAACCPAPGIDPSCAHPTAPEQQLLGISCGGGWVTRDDGRDEALAVAGMVAGFIPSERADNQSIQDAHRIQRCAAQPAVLRCQHPGGIWRSADAGDSWQTVSLHLPPIAAVRFD